MRWRQRAAIFGLILTTLLALAPLSGWGGEKTKEVISDPAEAAKLPDFQIQGEYLGQFDGGPKLGAQVIALGNGAFQAVLLPGGLPGAGWDGTTKILLDGKRENSQAVFTPAKGKRSYLAQSPVQFSATSKFPPAGQVDANASIADGKLTGKTDDGKAFALAKTERQSPTLGMKAPEGALILFDGSDTVEWRGGRLDKTTGLLNTDGSDVITKKKFNNYSVHLEFLLPYRPTARGQGRGNSGFYQVQHYELQILDSFGLDGKNNECGGFYTKAEPKVNMCLPPLVWQTYEVDFTNAVMESNADAKQNARATVRHNGVVIHDQTELNGPTGGHRNDPVGTPGPLLLQGHGNPLQFRNIWIVEKK